ncbi:electron transfer flavoprotein subunit alpha/FixB family protein [archaeon]|nr:MAG: electron transfer flavoprotein subunit alpha/FixB family protein [archaeon]
MPFVSRSSRSFLSSARRNASCLVLAEHDGAEVAPGTLAAVTAATKISQDITMLVMGKDLTKVANHAAHIQGVKSVQVLDNEVFNNVLAEDAAEALRQASANFTHILAASSSASKSVIPRAAALLDCAPVSDVTGVVSADTFVRPIYAGNALATVQVGAGAKTFLLVRGTAFDKAAVQEQASASISALSLKVDKHPSSSFVSRSAKQGGTVDLASAPAVVAGGRALKSAENFKLLDALAAKVNGAVGASRAAVDAGYAPNEQQVGQTGKVVAPALYVAVGISGAIQHLSGMKDSKVIVAINKDKDAPIFQVADYGLVDDLFKAVPELTSKL